MKECKECEYCEGFDRENGEPSCSYSGGYECCPFESYGESKKDGNTMKVEINLDHMEDYITHTFRNTIESQVKTTIAQIVNESCKEDIKKKTQICIDEILKKQVEEHMKGEISLGGGWNEKARVLTREEYLSELIQKKLDENFDKKNIEESVTYGVKKQIKEFTDVIKREINSSISDLFSQATRATLTENVVTMLMDNETYKKLSNSMGNLLKG